MNTELKKAIILFLLDNEKEFQLINSATKEFRNYIYTEKREYLIGGKDVSVFINDAAKLLHK